MQIQFTGHHIDVTPALKEFVTEKLERIQRHFKHITEVHVTFGIEHLSKVAEATIHVPCSTIHAKSESTKDMYSAVDTLVDKLDRMVKKHKAK